MTFQVALAATSAALAIYIAAMNQRFARAPGWRDQRWFTLVALSIAGYEALNIPTALPVPDAIVVAGGRGQLLFASLHAAAWLLYSRAQLRRNSRRRDLAVAAALGALGAVALVPGAVFRLPVRRTTLAFLDLPYAAGTTTPLGDLLLAAAFLVLGIVTLRYGAAWRRGVPYAGTHFAALAVFFVFVGNDILVATGAYAGPYVIDLAVLVPVAAVGYSFTSRFAEDARALAELRTRLEAAVEERTRELGETQGALHRAEKLAALTQFSTGVAHEVNNPAAVVGANLRYLDQCLEEGEFPADARECVQESIASVDRICAIVRQLLDAGRLAASKAPLEAVSVARCAREAVATLRLRIPARVAVGLAVDESLVACARRHVLVQVLVNLVANGADAIPPDRSGHVSIRAERRDGRVRLVVEDDGTGMDPAVVRRVFEPFFTTKPVGVGTGLGLAVSRGLVAGLGGTLTLESTVGRGTRAVVELAEAPGSAADPENEGAPVAPRGRRRTVLVLDADPAALRGMTRVLEPHYTVCPAGSAEEALALADARPPDLVLCDVSAGGAAAALHAALAKDLPGLLPRVVLLAGGPARERGGAVFAPGQPVLRKPLDLYALARIAERLSPDGSAAAPGGAAAAAAPAESA